MTSRNTDQLRLQLFGGWVTNRDLKAVKAREARQEPTALFSGPPYPPGLAAEREQSAAASSSASASSACHKSEKS